MFVTTHLADRKEAIALMRNTIIILSAAVLMLISACKKDSLGPDDQDGLQKAWVTRPQVNIPWPGLANSPWPMFLHDPQHTGRSPYRGPQSGRVEWAFQTGAEVYASPSIGPDGTIYIESWDHYLYALTPSGGAKWRFDLGGATQGNPTIGSDGTIYAGSSGSAFYALDETGQQRWTYDVGFTYKSGAVPSYDGQTIFFIAENVIKTTLGRWGLYAMTRDGNLKWVYAPPEKDLFPNGIAISPDGKTLYCPGLGNYQAPLYAIDTSGTQQWRFVAQGHGTNSTISSPCIDNDGNIYISSDAYLYSLTPTGTLRWQSGSLLSNAGGGPAIAWDGTIYLGGDFYFMAFDYSGTLKWQCPVQIVSGNPAIDVDSVVYIGTATYRGPTDTTNFLAFYPDGRLKFKLSLRGAAGNAADIVSSPAIASDGSIYVGSDRPHGFRLFKIR